MTDVPGFAALHYAVKVGSPEAIQMLIDNGADKEIRSTRDTKLLTPALLAVVEGQVKCLEKLIENDVDLTVECSKIYSDSYDQEDNNEDYGLFGLAVVHDQPKVIEFLVSLEEDKWRSIEKAENSAHVKHRGTIMSLAVKLERIECLETLLYEEFSPGENTDDLKHAVCMAVKTGNSEFLDLLLEYDIHETVLPRAEYTDVEQTALLYAVLRDDEQMLKTLCDNGFRICLWDGYMTALHGAAVQGNVNCLKYILEHKSLDVEDGIRAKDGFALSALWYAARRCHPESIKILIEAGAWPSDFEDALSIVECTSGHQHYCVPCQKKQLCICYGTTSKCQIKGIDHLELECAYHEDLKFNPDACTSDCNCDIPKTIEILCNYAISVYKGEDEVGKERVSQILNKAMNACICTDQPEALKWVLMQGADPTHWLTAKKGVHQFRSFLSNMRTPRFVYQK